MYSICEKIDEWHQASWKRGVKQQFLPKRGNAEDPFLKGEGAKGYNRLL